MTARICLEGTDPQLEALLADPGSFGFFEVVRFLSERFPDAPGPGGKGPYAQERIRFVQDPSMGFPAGDLSGVVRDTQGAHDCFEIQATFLGLSGAGTPLPPSFVTDLCIQDAAMDADRAYLDWIHHRLYGLLYRANQRLHELRCAPKSGQTTRSHPQLELIAPAIGQANDDGADLAQNDLLGLAPVLSQGNASVEMVEMCLARVLGPYLGPHSRVELVPMTGAWVDLQPQDRWVLGHEGVSLGENTMLGDQAWVRSLGVTLCILGVPWSLYQRHWVQTQTALLRAQDLCRRLVEEPLVWDLALEVVDLPTEGWILGQDALGASTWLLSSECETLWERRTLTELLAVQDQETGT